MEVVEKIQGDIKVFSLSGSLDSNTSPGLEERIMGVIENGANKIVVDFSDLDYISSAGLRVLNKATKKLKKSEGKMILCSMQDYIREVFEIAGFDYFIPIVNTMDDALAGFTA